MTKIELTPEQASIVSAARGPVRICLPDGSIVGWLKCDITPAEPIFTPEEIAEAERRLDAAGPWFTTEEVLESLREPRA